MNCVVVIPVYRQPNKIELLSFLQLKRLQIKNVVLICPYDLNVNAFLKWWPNISVERFENWYFKGIDTYNQLMLSVDLYNRFIHLYEWMLIHQLDAFLLCDQLEYFCSLPYDYYGAPWKRGILGFPGFCNSKFLRFVGKRFYVGNGGLSLRRISAIIKLLLREGPEANGLSVWQGNEDMFFGYWGIQDQEFISCPVKIASKFAFEEDPEYWYKENGVLPMGFHAFEKTSQTFYASIMKTYYFDLIKANPELNNIYL